MKPYRIVRDNSDLQNIIKAPEDTLNQFQDNLLDTLFCLTTGCAASSDVQNYLTSTVDSGTIWSDQFQDECKDDPSHFERPIKRRKIKNFASDAVKTKVKSKDQTILEVRCTRDIFG